MTKIKTIIAQEILNAKGEPAIETTVTLTDGATGSASCPSGEKVGNYEALDLKDKDMNRFEGQGVLKAIANIQGLIAPVLIGKDAENQQAIDKAMIDLDGTANKSRLGANAMLSVSMAIAKAAAGSSVLPLFLYLRQFVKKEKSSLLKIPTPIFNIVNSGRTNMNTDFYEFLVLPASTKTYTESIQIGEIIYKSFKTVSQAKGLQASDSGISSNLSTNKEVFSLIKQAIDDTQIRLGFDVFFGLNCKASSFFRNEKYHIRDSHSPLSSKDLVSYYEQLNKDVRLLYLEDPMQQDDWDGWINLFAKLSSTAIIAGGDLIATNPYRLQMAMDKKTINAVVIKPNQVGTVIEALAIAQAAKETGLKIIVSHRSAETNDDFLSDFAVAVAADYVKLGDLTRGENIAKYNRLLQIENQLKIL